MWWTLASAVAAATPVDDARVQALLDEVVPYVEARTERSLVRVPRAGIASRDELYPLLSSPSGLTAARHGDTWVPSQQLRRQVVELLEHAIAVYVAQSEQVVVVEEVLAQVVDRFQLAAEQSESLVQCVLTHELVHAVQHQYGVEATGPNALRRGQRALREGHASLVAGEYCEVAHGESTARLLDVVQNIELEASLEPEDEAAVYGWGRRLAETLEAEGLLWPALHASAPPWAGVVEAVQPTLAPDWQVADPLVEAVARLGLPGRTVHHTAAVSPTSILTPLFADQGGREAMPRAQGGFAAEAADEDGEVMILAFLLDDREAPARLVAARRQAAEGPEGMAWTVYGARTGPLAKWPRARGLRTLRHERVDDALRIVGRTGSGKPYTEAWVATQRRLFVVFDAGHVRRPRELATAARALVASLRPHRGAELGLVPLLDWVASVRAIDEASTRDPSWQYLLHRASLELAAGDEGACSDIFAARLVLSDDHARAAFECAAVPWDLALAEAAAAQLAEVPAIPAVRLVAHALDVDQPGVASRILAKTVDAPDLALQIATLRVATAVKLGSWTEVEAVVRRTPMLPAGLRAWAGSA
ncbi:MAG: hypothetical protein AAF211_24610, partial [Myxococcota bacterium]